MSLQCQHWRGRDGQITGAGWLVSQPCLFGEHQVQSETLSQKPKRHETKVASHHHTQTQTQTYLRMYLLESLKFSHVDHLHVDSHALHHETTFIFFGELYATLVDRQIGEHSGCPYLLMPFEQGFTEIPSAPCSRCFGISIQGLEGRRAWVELFGAHSHCHLTPPLPFKKA